MLSIAALGVALSGGTAWAQTAAGEAAAAVSRVSPVTVTPPSLVPPQQTDSYRVDIPEAGALQPPPGAETLAVTLSDVHVQGSFPEVAGQVQAALARIRGRRVTLAEIYAVASEIEAIHARAGYVLARVSVPPQDLRDGGDLRIVVTDGYIESVDVSALPARIHRPVMARAGRLIGRRHIKMAEIEKLLMLTSDIPGLTLRSTLMHGDKPGGTRLVLEGKQQLISGSFGIDNQLDPSLGNWEGTLQVSVNSALGLGEQIYGFVSSGYQVDRLFDDNARERVVGGGVVLPFGDGQFSLNPEAVLAHTAPIPVPGAPRTWGTLRRLTLRANDTLVRTRNKQAGLTLTVEQIEETNELPDFAMAINHDRYMAARLGGSLFLAQAIGGSLSANIQLSQGLGDLGAISASDALASGVPFTRQGASTSFTKLTAGAHIAWALGNGISYTLNARGQTSFGEAMFRAEQFVLEGYDGLSAYVGGITAQDSGAVVRSELAAQLASTLDHGQISQITPYIFSAFGAGKLERPTALEPRSLSAFNLGAGVHVTLAGRIGVNLEYAYGLSDNPILDGVSRVNFSTVLKF